jgi:ATP-dependent RNA helicase RhlE
MEFRDLRLTEPILRAISAEGYNTPTPIQAQAIPHVLAGRDLLGCAQTGTGKTAAFALPVLHALTRRTGPTGDSRARAIRALILSPTRELASQITDSFRIYGQHCGLRHAVVFGGVNQNPQTKLLRQGVDILIATPGRLLDLMNQGFVDLSRLEIFVLDEADRMLDMGFIHDIRRIEARVPRKRQTLMFSATMPRDIRELAEAFLKDPVSVQVTPVASTVETIDQSVYFVIKRNKPVLLKHLLETTSMTRCLVFTRTKHGADRVVRQLSVAGVRAEAIHGNKSQNNRQRALGNFKSGKTPVLVATDIAARGIDVDGVSHVINFDVPHEPETYVHRIGRTGRAGASGVAIAFCDHEERGFLHNIQRLIKKPLAVNENHPAYPAQAQVAVADVPRREHHRPQGGYGGDRTGRRPFRQHRRTNRSARGNGSF